ncbi:MAG: hypothetical protein EOO56_16445 [Hymenobacter sp.]|nr:MAG: hypothetical protein EOO56_16445 [Hymenobacter sp.]
MLITWDSLVGHHLTLSSIGFKKDFTAKVRYGQRQFDFDEGMLGFTSPGQVFSLALGDGDELTQVGRLVLIHPDFLWNMSLARKMKHYEFFTYAVNEVLFLSANEEASIAGIMQTIETNTRLVSMRSLAPDWARLCAPSLPLPDFFFQKDGFTR